MAVYETWLKSDLKKPITVKQLPGTLFLGDDESNLIGVEITDNGNTPRLTGTVYGYIIRDDDETIVVEGTLSSGCKASIVLPATAYAVPGMLSIVIKIGSTTVGACVAKVFRGQTDVIADPTNIIPSIEELLARIEECLAASLVSQQASATAVVAARMIFPDAEFPFNPQEEVISEMFVNIMHPIGSIYQSVDSTNPGELFPGTTWESLGGKFLIGADETYTAGSTGGSATHTLTYNEMPSHNHGYNHYNDAGSDGWIAKGMIGSTTGGNGMRVDGYTANAGGGAAFSIMPPYQAVYMWKRTA